MDRLGTRNFFFAIVVASVSLISMAGVNLVQNGDFEACGFTGNYKENCGSTYLIGWECSAAGIATPKGTYISTAISAYDDSAWAFLKSKNSYIAQDIVVTTPGIYCLEFDFTGRPNYINNANTEVTFGDTTLTNIVGAGRCSNGSLVDHVVCDEIMITTPGTYKLKFTETNAGDVSPAFDNISFASAAAPNIINVAASPTEYGSPSPAYGIYDNREAGTTYSFTAPAAWTNALGTLSVVCTGWTYATNNVLDVPIAVSSGSGNTASILYNGGFGILTWQWEVENESAPGAYDNIYDYLESDGTQVIDLGVKMAPQTMVELYFQRSSSASAMQKIFGAYSTSNGVGAAVGCSTALALSSTFNTSWLPSVAVGADSSVRMQVQTVYFKDGGYQYSLPKTKSSSVIGNGGGRFVEKIQAQDLNYYAFGVNVDGAAGGTGAVRIKRILILSDDSAVLHDFRAAMKGGVYGLYDMVSGAFRTNSAADANVFVPGPETMTAADALEIDSDPSGLSLGFAPALGVRSGLSAGDELPVSAPSVSKSRLSAICTGWTLYSWDPDTGNWVEDAGRENHSGNAASFTYRHTGVASKIVWHYTLSDPGADQSVTTRYVWTGLGNDANDGSSWTRPFRRIQAAIDASDTGDTVLVGPGVYIDPRGFILTNSVKVVSACGYRDTVIDGDRFRQGASIAAGAEMDGFAITNCVSGMGANGGGAAVAGVLRRCFISENKSGTNSRGGGLSITGSGLVSQSIVCSNYNNTAWGGVGVQMIGTSVIEHSLIFDNVHENGGDGGGIYLVSNQPKVRYCTIYGNCATAGGGISSAVSAAGIHDCIIWGNRTTGDTSEGAPNWKGSGKVTNVFSSVSWGVTVGDAVLSGNPYFKNAAAYDFSLAGNSPCRDAAWGVTDVTEDVFGNPRVQNGHMDIGAIENDPNEKSASMSYVVSGSLDTATVAFTANATGFDIASATCYWTFDGRTPTAADHDATGATVTHDYGCGTHSAALAVVYGGETYSDRQADIVTVAPSKIYVNSANENPVAPYDSWAKAAQNLPEAYEVAAQSGSTVFVEEGSYLFSSQIDVSKQVRFISMKGPEKTVLDGNRATRIMAVTIGGVEINGFTFACAKATSDGAALRMSGGFVTNCVFRGNACEGNAIGGAVYMNGGLVSGCVISNNSISVSWWGGAVAMDGGILENSLLCDNTAGNSASGSGGALTMYLGGTVRHCTIVNNHATNSGGIHIRDQRGQKVHDTIVWGNTATGNGQEVGGNITQSLWTNVITAAGVDSETGNPIEVGVNATRNLPSLAVDPHFVDAENGNWHLFPSSPCRNNGWGIPAVSVDLDGRPRIHGRSVDIGCYEIQCGAGLNFILR